MSEKEKFYFYSLNQTPEEIAAMCDRHISAGNPNISVVGSAFLNFKAAQLNAESIQETIKELSVSTSKITSRLVVATWALVLATILLVIVTCLFNFFCR